MSGIRHINNCLIAVYSLSRRLINMNLFPLLLCLLFVLSVLSLLKLSVAVVFFDCSVPVVFVFALGIFLLVFFGGFNLGKLEQLLELQQLEQSQLEQQQPESLSECITINDIEYCTDIKDVD